MWRAGARLARGAATERPLRRLRRCNQAVQRRRIGYTENAGTQMATHRYTIILEREADGGFHVFCPALKGCHSQGDSLDEAVDNIREAIEAYLESVEAHGEPIPQEDLLFKPVEVAR